MKRLGGNVTMRLYPNMGHTVNLDEIEFVSSMMTNLVHANERVHGLDHSVFLTTKNTK